MPLVKQQGLTNFERSSEAGHGPHCPAQMEEFHLAWDEQDLISYINQTTWLRFVCRKKIKRNLSWWGENTEWWGHEKLPCKYTQERKIVRFLTWWHWIPWVGKMHTQGASDPIPSNHSCLPGQHYHKFPYRIFYCWLHSTMFRLIRNIK